MLSLLKEAVTLEPSPGIKRQLHKFVLYPSTGQDTISVMEKKTQTPEKQREKRNNDTGGAASSQAKRRKRLCCGCPYADPQEMAKLCNAEEAAEMTTQCRCNLCGPGRCTVRIHSIIVLMKSFFCEVCDPKRRRCR